MHVVPSGDNDNLFRSPIRDNNLFRDIVRKNEVKEDKSKSLTNSLSTLQRRTVEQNFYMKSRSSMPWVKKNASRSFRVNRRDTGTKLSKHSGIDQNEDIKFLMDSSDGSDQNNKDRRKTLNVRMNDSNQKMKPNYTPNSVSNKELLTLYGWNSKF